MIGCGGLKRRKASIFFTNKQTKAPTTSSQWKRNLRYRVILVSVHPNFQNQNKKKCSANEELSYNDYFC